MRKRLYNIISTSPEGGVASKIYDAIIICAVIIGIIPLAFKESGPLFVALELISVSVFLADYLLRFICADLRLKKSWVSFLIHPFTPSAIIDLVCILPFVAVFSRSFAFWLKIAGLFRPLKLLRLFKLFRHTRSYAVISAVFRKQKKILIATFVLAFVYILFSALIMFTIEPDIFDTFIDAVYWATVSLTTVGYGDITPASAVGKIITVLSSLVGIGIIALPSGVITAGYIEEFHEMRDKNNK